MTDYRIPLHELEALSKGRIHQSRHNHFVRVPWEWMCAANLLRGSAFAVGALLWYRSKLTGDPVTVLSNVLAEEAGLSRKSKTSGLKALVAGGLAKAVGGPGKSPRVVILTLSPGTATPAPFIPQSADSAQL